MRPSILLLVLILVSCGCAHSGGFDGVVSIYYDYSLNGVLQIDQKHRKYRIKFSRDGERLTGAYVGLDNDSIWELGIVSSRGTSVVSGFQKDRDWFRVLAGEIKSGKIIGTWYGVGGISGDFEIFK